MFLRNGVRRIYRIHKTFAEMNGSRRFDIYVKAARDGSLGDCPFSQRVLMYAKLKLQDDQYQVLPMDVVNKTDDLLTVSPEGKVPVLVDHQAGDKVVLDSGEITKYIDSVFPQPDCNCQYDGPANDVCMGVFPKLAGLLKNKDESQTMQLKEALKEELKKVDEYLKGRQKKSTFILGDKPSEIDCMFLPKLRHVIVAGKHYKDFTIPEEYSALQDYIDNAKTCEAFTSTSCPDEEIRNGWSKFFSC